MAGGADEGGGGPASAAAPLLPAQGRPPAVPSSEPASDPDKDGLSTTQLMLHLLPIVYMPSFLYGLSDGVALANATLYPRSLGLSDGLVGMCAGARPLGKFIADVPVGFVVARLGVKRAMMLGLSLYTVCAMASAVSTSFIMLFLSLLVSGFCEAAFTVSRSSYLKGAVTPSFRGRAISALGGVNRMSRVIGPAVGGLVSHHVSARAPFVLRGLLGLCAASFVAVCLPGSIKSSARGTTQVLSTFVRFKRIYLTIGIACFVLSFIRKVRTMAVPGQGDDLGMSHDKIGFALTIGFFFDSLLFLPVGFAMDHYGRRKTAIPAFIVLSTGLCIIAMSKDALGLSLGSIAAGIGNGLSSGLQITLATDSAPGGKDTGPFLGVFGLLTDGGAMTGPVVTGLLSEHLGLPAALLIAGQVGFVGSMWFIFTVKETLHREPQNLQKTASPAGSGDLAPLVEQKLAAAAAAAAAGKGKGGRTDTPELEVAGAWENGQSHWVGQGGGWEDVPPPPSPA